MKDVNAILCCQLLIAGCILARRDLLTQLLVGSNVLLHIRARLNQKISNHAAEYYSARLIDMSAITLAQVVGCRILGSNGVDIVGASRGKVQELGPGLLCCCDGGLAPFNKVLLRGITVEVAATEGCNDDLASLGSDSRIDMRRYIPE